jgi:hypothetical protein
MSIGTSHHPWSEDGLFSKAILYVEEMEACATDDWKYGFWSALSLELLARAAVAHISPLLLGDKDNWRNLTYALGQEPTVKKFSPTSISTNDVLGRLGELVPAFSEELVGFCRRHIDRRNAELHTGECAFESLQNSEWLPKFYASAKVLLQSMKRGFDDLFSDVAFAEQMVASLGDAAAKAVNQEIQAHATVWLAKSEEERTSLVANSQVWALRQAGHRVPCPACKSTALIDGAASGSVTTEIDFENDVVQRQRMLPSSFACIACGLRISGLSKLSACGLGNAFTARTVYAAAEFFGLHTEDELEEARNSGMLHEEEDYNE